MKLNVIPTWTADYKGDDGWVDLPGVFKGSRTQEIIGNVLNEQPQATGYDIRISSFGFNNHVSFISRPGDRPEKNHVRAGKETA